MIKQQEVKLLEVEDFYDDMLAIATIQDKLNKSMAGPDWMDRAGAFIEDDSHIKEDEIPLDYRAAIYDEMVSELMRCSYNYEWWKPLQELDLANAGVELVDIMHFAISMDLAQEHKFEARTSEENVEAVEEDYLASPHTFVAYNAAFYAASIANNLDVKYSRAGFRAYFNSLLGGVTQHEFSWEDYWGLCGSLGFQPGDIIGRYIFKASLNLFRTQNGYREKKYVKKWFVPMNDGTIGEVEDNDVLLTYCAEFFKETSRYPNHREVMEFLRTSYEQCKTNPEETTA